MAKPEPIFTRATFQFFRDLARNNRKVWMDANRERYQEFVVKPFRRLLEEVSPAVLQLDSRFDTTGRTWREFLAHQPRHPFRERQNSVSCANVFEILRAISRRRRNRPALHGDFRRIR